MTFTGRIQDVEPLLTMLVVTRSAMVVVVIVVPAPVGENNATAQGQDGQQGNQQCDSTQHVKVLMVIAAMKLKLFIGCNMRPRM
jgi:hypothetical protein